MRKMWKMRQMLETSMPGRGANAKDSPKWTAVRQIKRTKNWRRQTYEFHLAAFSAAVYEDGTECKKYRISLFRHLVYCYCPINFKTHAVNTSGDSDIDKFKHLKCKWERALQLIGVQTENQQIDSIFGMFMCLTRELVKAG